MVEKSEAQEEPVVTVDYDEEEDMEGATLDPDTVQDSSLGKMLARMEAQSKAIRAQCPDYPFKTAFEKRASRLQAFNK